MITPNMKDIPDKYYNMVQAKEEKDPLKPDFAFIVPSPQFWNDLTKDEQVELKEIVTGEAQDLDKYLYEMRRMLPKNPRGKC